MAENKAAAADAQDKPKKKSPQADKKEKSKKAVWTMEKCVKTAKRFSSLDAWQQGAPSSYKAAASREWLKECAKHLSPKTVSKAVSKFKKSA